MIVRTLSVVIVHQADRAAENGNFRGVEFWHYVAPVSYTHLTLPTTPYV